MIRPTQALFKRSVWKGSPLPAVSYSKVRNFQMSANTAMTRPKPRSFPTPKDSPSTTRYSGDPDTRSSSNDPPEFRGHQVRGSQWQDLPGDLHHGRNGWEEVG